MQDDNLLQGDDFDSVKARVDAANNTTGKEVRSLYSDEGKTVAQRQAESRLFFSTLKNVLFCILLIALIVILIKKGLNLKKLKGMLTDDEEQDAPTDQPVEEAEVSDKPEPKKPEPKSEVPESVPSDNSDEEEEPTLEE